jgi:hypothetical protein
MSDQDRLGLQSLGTEKLRIALLASAVILLILLVILRSPFTEALLPSDLSLDRLGDAQNRSVVARDFGQTIKPHTNSPPDILQQGEDHFTYLPAIMNNWHEEPFHFEFRDNKLSVYTQQMALTIESGAITYVEDKASGEVLVDTDAYMNRPSVTEGFVGFTSRDADSNFHLRWPTQSSSVSFSRVSTNTVRLMYAPLYFHDTPSNSQLIVDLTIDETSGEVIVQLTGIEADPTLKPFSLDLPVMNMTTPSVILGSGAQYLRTDAKATDQSMYSDLGLYSPTMAVVEGSNATLAAWSETTHFAPECIQLLHKPSYDHLILHGEQDPKQADPQKIVSPPWRIGTYPTWVKAAKRWREKFEERTGARPLWENRTPWVRNIHAVFNATNQNYGADEDESKHAELASKAPPEKVLYFLWNGDRIVLYGDHTLVSTIARPTPELVDIIKQYGWPLILFHPYTLIYSEAGAADRLQYLADQGWLPAGYQFAPDYEGTAENWQNYWSGVRADYFDDSVWYMLHPGSTKFKNYLVHNFGAYCTLRQADGAYLDTLGDDNNFLFADSRKTIEGQDYILGELNAIAKVTRELPHLAVMSEYQSPWMLPFAFYSWEGSVSHIRQNAYANTRINHPLRVALTGSYSWTKESNEEHIDDIVAALLGTLPEISLVGDDSVSEERALWSQARAQLFCDEELFNDLPDKWDEDALAYYRSRSGHWFKFELLGSTYGYVEVFPGGQEVIRLSK